MKALALTTGSSSLDSSAITIWGFSNHIYVIYCSPSSGIYYIADGSNHYINDQSLQEQVIQHLGFSPVGVKFVGQSPVYHCASSAALIVLEFRRVFRNKQEPTLFKAERTLTDRIKKDFHPFVSQNLESQGPFRNLEFDQCPYCPKQFASRNRLAFTGHVQTHKLRAHKK